MWTQAISNGATGWLYFAVNEWLNFFVGKCTKEMPHCSEWSNHTAVATRAPSNTARTTFSPQGSGFASGDGLYVLPLHSAYRTNLISRDVISVLFEPQCVCVWVLNLSPGTQVLLPGCQRPNLVYPLGSAP